MNPIDGHALLVATAKASVSANRLPVLLEQAQLRLADQRETYRRRYELAIADDDYEAFFVETDHWETLGDDWGFDDRERAAVARAHREHLLWVGRRANRRDEFETALELREVVIIGQETGGGTKH